jgi:hypothetical protein
MSRSVKRIAAAAYLVVWMALILGVCQTAWADAKPNSPKPVPPKPPVEVGGWPPQFYGLELLYWAIRK